MSKDNEQLNLIKQEPKFIDTLQLSKDETYKLSYQAPESMFELKDTRSTKEVNDSIKASDVKLSQMMKSDSDVRYSVRRQTQTNRFRDISAALYKDKKWYSIFQRESPEMVRVKKTVAYLNNLLDRGIDDYVKEEGTDGVVLDAEGLKEAVHKAFEEVISACENYLEKKKQAGQGRWSTGIRRMELVSRVLQTCKEERSKYELTVDALQYNSLEGFDLKELRGSADDVPEDGELQEEQNEQEELKQDEKLVRKEKKVYNLHALSAMHKHSVAVKTDWQNQGNSTDVYRIVVKEEGSDVVYYIKENLPLLSSDVEGFLDRRLTELASSKQAHVSNDSSREELRMREAHMKEADYDACTRFLTAIKNKIQNAPAAERLNVRKRMTAIFAHDFDRMFKQLHYHNQAARILDKEGDNFDVAKWTAVAKNQDNPQYEIAKILLDYMGYDLEGNKIDASDAGAEAREPLKEINEK
ncbi:MAG: hypothetical protein IKR36_03975, partial [Clostridia bacterium]|nr:hypothetical protein [Clostridia bacterium]